MHKLIFFVICLVISLSLADNEKNLETLDTGKLDVIEMFDVDNDRENSGGHQKRDSGYSYPRPDRLVKFKPQRLSKGLGRYATRFPTNIVKPFPRYGPPKETSLHVFFNNHQILRPRNQRNRNRYYQSPQLSNNNIQFSVNNKLNGNLQLNLPNSIRGIGFSSGSDPISNQNSVPFDHNSANYLPPKNQKLPIYSPHSNFQQSQTHSNIPQQFRTNINSQQLNQDIQSQTHQLSDAAQFLTQNAQAISQLYETPATNLNYAPTPGDNDEPTNNQSLNPNSQFQTLNSAKPSQPHQNFGTFTGQLPTQSSDILESQRVLEKLISEEKDRLINQLQQALSSQRQTSVPNTTGYTQNHGSYFDTQKLLDNFQNNGHQNVLDGVNVASGQRSIQHDPPATSYGVPINPSTISLTASTASNSIPVHQPQSSVVTDNFHVTTSIGQPTTTFSFPQYGSFTPSVIAATNIVSGLPPHYDSTHVGANPSNQPTHFSIPIETNINNNNNKNNNNNNNNKPILGSAPSTSIPSKSIFPSVTILPPVHPTPLSISQVNPLLANPIKSIFPIVPSVNLLQKSISTSHPPYSIQPTLVNSVFLKPVNQVYPVYYYPNAAYQVQKPGVALPVYPKSYLSSHLETRPNQTWK